MIGRGFNILTWSRVVQYNELGKECRAGGSCFAAKYTCLEKAGRYRVISRCAIKQWLSYFA